jgi:hypothetical protein
MHASIRRERCETLSHRQMPCRDGDEPTMEPPLIAALFSFAHIRKEIAMR